MNCFRTTRPTGGFTLIELLVVVGVIAVLATVVTVALSGRSAAARDLERQADLRNLQGAIEQYKHKYGRYPEAGCGTANGSWATESCDTYIVGVAPEFIARLPKDPEANGANGYSYRTNAAGTVYKLAARGTVESETVTADHEFALCAASCGTTGVCDPNGTTFQNAYAVWGGFAAVAQHTDNIVCD